MLSSGHHRHSIYKHTYTHKHIHTYFKKSISKNAKETKKRDLEAL